MSLVGTTLNQRFYILKSLAPGGFGHTYLAEDRSFQARHLCVVKHLSPAKENLPYLDRIKELFHQEADILAKFNLYSNNLIPKLIDRFEEDGELYLVQEFIDGVPLSAELTPGKKLTPAATIELLTQILTPVRYCHDEGLVHRDLKPDNIMRRRQQVGIGDLVLIDFGICKDMGAASITKHSYGGTPGYAPEEQITYGLPEPASDIYAVGTIAIQALTGLYPHQLRRNPDTMEWDLHKYCDITAEFTQVLNKMVEFFAIRRYQNAREALAAVKSLPMGGNKILPSPQPKHTKHTKQPTIFHTSAVARSPQQPAPQPKPVQPTRQKFSFQTAKLEIITSKTGLLGLGEKRSEAKITRISGTAEYITEDLGNGVKLEMIYIQVGSFMMGSNESDREKPIHRVNLSPFYMGKYAITQQQYQAIMGNNPSRFKGDNRPIESVSWDDAVEFCQKLSQRTGKSYILPSESQWEYACRAGTTTPFCFGETITPDLVNYDGNYTYGQAPKGRYRQQTTDVGSFPPNAFGLYDMHGNVWEWCLDGWHENYHGAPTDGSQWVNNDNDLHLLRGGSWNYGPDYCRSAGRDRGARGNRGLNYGFRVVALPSPGFP
jgi:eukaryotic-like serine/threonine-protein kinase